MLVKNKNNTLVEYKKKLLKSLEGYADRTPIKIKINMLDSTCILDAYELDKKYIINIDYTENIIDVIKNTRDWFYINAYPCMKKVEVLDESLSIKEVEDLIDSGVSPDQAVMVKKSRDIITDFIIEKAIIKKNQLVVRDITNKSLDLYDIKIPIVPFLYDSLFKWNEVGTYEVFKKNSILVKKGLKDALGEPKSE